MWDTFLPEEPWEVSWPPEELVPQLREVPTVFTFQDSLLEEEQSQGFSSSRVLRFQDAEVQRWSASRKIKFQDSLPQERLVFRTVSLLFV